MSTSKFAQAFAAKAAKVNPSAPSNTKWNGVRDLLAEEVGVESDDVYVATVSKPGNTSVRFAQSDAADAGAILVGMNTYKPSALDQSIDAVRRVADGRVSVAALGMRVAGNWTIVAILGATGKEPEVLTLSSSFPNAVVLQM
jgi:hypothetical protein